MLELDSVNPLLYVTDDIWGWTDAKRDMYLKDECQVLCSPCYLRKKRMWKKFRLENDDWYRRFKEQKFHLD